jgi:thiamine-phosphate pyrophosphorylase
MAPQSSSSRPILCAVLDATALGKNPGDTARALFHAGVDWIQLRDRSLEADALQQLANALVGARDLARATAESPCLVIVNRRIDIALSTGADGVHLGFDGLDATAAAVLLPENALIGVSLHSVREVEALAEKAPDNARLYAHLAPIWNPISKPATRPALGLDRLSRACSRGTRVLAQGGLDAAHAIQAIRAGAAGIAVSGILTGSGDPITAAGRLREALDGQNQPEG